ncbi:hypothetical protein K501DRAFT_284769 [Backusella circina FSU 941]|nr:hypothetical protein K501DRAFT_284769 [Backusella circina FSU 941]
MPSDTEYGTLDMTPTQRHQQHKRTALFAILCFACIICLFASFLVSSVTKPNCKGRIIWIPDCDQEEYIV